MAMTKSKLQMEYNKEVTSGCSWSGVCVFLAVL